MRFDICGACVVKCSHVHSMYEGLVKSCVALVCFRLAARVMDPSFPPVLSCLRAAIPLSFALILRLCGATAVAELAAFWRCPLRLLDDLHALVCR